MTNGSTLPTTTPSGAEPIAQRSVSGSPSVHVRAVLTWLAIFPLVSIGMLAFAPLWPDWHPIVRALVLTLIVVPLAVYLVVPQLLRAHGALRRHSVRK